MTDVPRAARTIDEVLALAPARLDRVAPEALAAAMETVWADRGNARDLGQAGFETLARRGIAWEHVLDRLLA